MKFAQLVELTADVHCFSPGMVMAGQSADQVRLQLSRWVHSGRLMRIHKGWYALNAPYRRVQINMNVIATTIKVGSYISLHAALAYHGMIPEHVAETTAVTTGRPATIATPFGRIRYQHIKPEAFCGCTRHDAGLQHQYIATPEKALLDLLYLTPGADSAHYLAGLRLQHTDELDLHLLRQLAERFATPKMHRAVELLAQLLTHPAGHGDEPL